MTSGVRDYTMNRRTVLKTLGVSGITGLAGCIGGGGSGSNQSGTEVHLITEEGSDAAREFWNRVGKDFKKKSGIKLNMEYVGINAQERLAQLLQAGDPPEIFMSSQGTVATFQNQGVLAPVDEVFQTLKQRIGKPNEMSTVVINDKNWLVPLYNTVGCYHYRGDLSDIVPDTWEKTLQYATETDGKQGLAGTYVPAGPGEHQCYRIMSWMFSKGASLCAWKDNKIEVVFDKGKNRKAMKECMEFTLERREYSPPATDSGWTTWSNAIPSQVSASALYIGFRPELKAARQNAPFTNSMMTIPGMPKPNGGSNTAAASAEGFCTFNQANNKAAVKFMEFVLQKEYLVDLYTSLAPGHNIPAYPEIKNGEAYQQRLDKVVSDSISDEAIKTYQNAPFKTRPADTDPVNPYAGAAYGSPPLWNMQTEIMVNDMPIDKAIDKYAKKLQQAIDEVQG
jgi:multiple sugar transport system substrate-binding protein